LSSKANPAKEPASSSFDLTNNVKNDSKGSESQAKSSKTTFLSDFSQAMGQTLIFIDEEGFEFFEFADFLLPLEALYLERLDDLAGLGHCPLVQFSSLIRLQGFDLKEQWLNDCLFFRVVIVPNLLFKGPFEIAFLLC
jgi:hypothetical protein